MMLTATIHRAVKRGGAPTRRTASAAAAPIPSVVRPSRRFFALPIHTRPTSDAKEWSGFYWALNA